MIYLSNVLSLSMIPETGTATVRQTTVDEIRATGFKSIIWHRDTAMVIAGELRRNVPCVSSANITFTKGDIIYIAELLGAQEPTGYALLPHVGVKRFLKVTIN